MMNERILVIRLGALGDLVLCFAAFQAIRNAHPGAEIALLTMPAFAGFAKQLPWFDRVIVDPRAPRWRVDAWVSLMRRVRRFGPGRVYDLQGKSRQAILFWLLGGSKYGPEWSGAAPGCSHPRLWPPEPGMHFVDFVTAQLERAGIDSKLKDSSQSLSPLPNPSAFAASQLRRDGPRDPASPYGYAATREEGIPYTARGRSHTLDLSWLDGELGAFELPEKFALLIPGCAANRPYKRWPAGSYAELARRLQEKDIGSVAIGTEADGFAIREITTRAPDVVDLCGKTSLAQVAALARRAVYVIGNDTGPTHLAAAVGGRVVALMSDKVDPAWSAPRGPYAFWLQGRPLAELGVGEVFNALAHL